MRAVGVKCSLCRCDNVKIRVKSSLIIKVCFAHQISVEIKQTHSKDISEGCAGTVVEGQEAGKSFKTVFKDMDQRGKNLDFYSYDFTLALSALCALWGEARVRRQKL